MLVELHRAKVPDVDPSSPILGRWISQYHATPHHVAQACIEASRAQDAPKPLTMAYLDAIVKRLASTDQRIHNAAEARHERTQATITEQRALPPPGPIPESTLPDTIRRALHRKRNPDDFEAIPSTG